MGNGLRRDGGEFKRLGGHPSVAAGDSGRLAVPARAIQPRAFGLQNGCRTGPERRVRIAISLQMGGSAYGIRTRVTAVRGRRPRPLDECATQERGCCYGPGTPAQRRIRLAQESRNGKPGVGHGVQRVG